MLVRIACLLAFVVSPITEAWTLSPSASSTIAQRYPKLSPFSAVRLNGETYEVKLETKWYKLVELHGLEAKIIFEHCKKVYPRNAEKRFAEDLVEVLDSLGHENVSEVDLVLVDLSSGRQIKRSKVAMTAANRDLVWDARQPAKRPATPIQRVNRKHAWQPKAHFEFLAEALEWDGWKRMPQIPRNAAMQDLDQLEWAIEHTYSYRDLVGVDYRAALHAIRSGLPEHVALGAFATRIGQFLALFGDGHTRVRQLEALRPSGYLPFLMEATEAGVVALASDRSSFVNPDFPFVEAIDGKPLEEWIEVSKRSVAAGSQHFVQRHALRDLRLFNAQRVELGMPLTSEFELLLMNEAGEGQSVVVGLASRKPVYGPWPRPSEARKLDSEIGYLPIASMESDAEFLRELTITMDSFRDTRGLIIDVRGNGGGSRDALRTLLPYFLAPDGDPHMVNVAAYRVRPGETLKIGDSYLENRNLFPLDASVWSNEERRLIQAAAETFQPDWSPKEEDFSPWHYFMIQPGAAYHYARPVVILMDAGCFSATDIFLGGFKGLPGVTLMGSPSGGGSGRSQGIELTHSRLSLRLSTMASFRPDGSRYDGKGIAPDIHVAPTPESFLEGAVDVVLEAALERLRP